MRGSFPFSVDRAIRGIEEDRERASCKKCRVLLSYVGKEIFNAFFNRITEIELDAIRGLQLVKCIIQDNSSVDMSYGRFKLRNT